MCKRIGIAEKIVGLRDMTVQYLDQLDAAGEGVVKITKGKIYKQKSVSDQPHSAGVIA